MIDAADVPSAKDLVVLRRLLALAGIIYLLWYFIVELVLPNSFNPFLSRLAVSLIIFAIISLSYVSGFFARHLRLLGLACTCLITLHYYYLFYFNNADVNWVIGCYITVIAINICLSTIWALMTYSGFVIALSLGIIYAHPELRNHVFLPGLVTVLIQANLVLRWRLGLLKNLEDSNARFQLLFDSAFEAILVHDKGIIVDTNKRITDVYGFTREEFIGRSVLDIVHPDDRETIGTHLRMTKPPVYEARAMTKDGRSIHIEIRAKDFFYDGKPMRLVTANDITDRKLAEKERITALTLAENVRIRDEFISMASHELKTPISALKLQTHLIEKDIEHSSNPEKFHGIIALFNRQIDRLTELVNTMLDVSRISSGRFTLEPMDFDLTAMVKEVISAKRITSPSHNIQLECPDRVDLRADKRRLEQVVENLLSNALKYGDGKPVLITVGKTAVLALLTVEDHGLGISPEFIPKIFDRFERAISARNISGLGLGLYITKQIVEAHNGTIYATSTLGKGSVFTVNLPLA